MSKNILQNACEYAVKKTLAELEIEGSEINIGLNTQLVGTLAVLGLNSELYPKVLSIFKTNLKQTGSNLLFSRVEDIDGSNPETLNLAITLLLVELILDSIQQTLDEMGVLKC